MELAPRVSSVGLPPARRRAGSLPRSDARSATGHLGGPLLVLGSSASLQSSAALATTVFAVYGPVGTGALRFALAAPLLLLVARPRLRGRTRAFWLTVVALGITLVSLNVALYEAIARAPLGAVVTLQFLGPLALALAGARRRFDLLWVGAAGTGVALLAGSPSGASMSGVAFALGAAAITVASLVLSKRLAGSSSGLDGLALAISVAALVTLPASVSAVPATGHAGDLALVGCVAVLGLALPYGLEYAALRRVSVKTFSVLLSLDPAVAALAGALLLGQRLGAAGTLGVALVVGASAGAMSTRDSA